MVMTVWRRMQMQNKLHFMTSQNCLYIPQIFMSTRNPFTNLAT